MVMMPSLIRAAPRLGMIDEPDARKVHVIPVARVGGIAIATAAIVSMLMWMPIDITFATYIFGVAALVFFGSWDDRKQIGHYVKFFGQAIAVIPVVYVGDLYVGALPFMSEPLPAAIGSVEPANGSPLCSKRDSASLTVLPMSKQTPVLLRCPSCHQRT